MPNDMMIEAEELAKRYGGTRALAGVDFAVPGGSILGLLGPNGAGKTTAVRILTTLALPDAGRSPSHWTRPSNRPTIAVNGGPSAPPRPNSCTPRSRS